MSVGLFIAGAVVAALLIYRYRRAWAERQLRRAIRARRIIGAFTILLFAAGLLVTGVFVYMLLGAVIVAAILVAFLLFTDNTATDLVDNYIA